MIQPLIMFACDLSRFVVLGLFLTRIRWFIEQNWYAITTEAIWVRTGASDTLVSLFSVVNGAFERDMHWRGGKCLRVWALLAEGKFHEITDT